MSSWFAGISISYNCSNHYIWKRRNERFLREEGGINAIKNTERDLFFWNFKGVRFPRRVWTSNSCVSIFTTLVGTELCTLTNLLTANLRYHLPRKTLKLLMIVYFVFNFFFRKNSLCTYFSFGNGLLIPISYFFFSDSLCEQESA